MPRYIAFLRAINVGGHTVRMDRLRQLFEALRFSDVETFIASGNVIFSTSGENAVALEKTIARHLEKALGYEVATFLRSPADVAEVAAHQPFAKRELTVPGHSLFVTFLERRPGAEGERSILRLRSDVDDLCVHGREIYWLRRGKFGESPIQGALLEKAAGMRGTIRNVTTVRKLAAKYAATID